MNKELKESRQVVAVLTVEDIDNYLWKEQIEQLNSLIKIIESGRKADGKKRIQTFGF